MNLILRYKQRQKWIRCCGCGQVMLAQKAYVINPLVNEDGTKLDWDDCLGHKYCLHLRSRKNESS